MYLLYNITFLFFQACKKYFNNTDKASDKKICYICGHHKKLYVCSDKKCPSAFCKVTIDVEIYKFVLILTLYLYVRMDFILVNLNFMLTELHKEKYTFIITGCRK